MSVEKWNAFEKKILGMEGEEWLCRRQEGMNITCLRFYPAWGRHRSGRCRCTLALLPTT